MDIKTDGGAVYLYHPDELQLEEDYRELIEEIQPNIFVVSGGDGDGVGGAIKGE